MPRTPLPRRKHTHTHTLSREKPSCPPATAPAHLFQLPDDELAQVVDEHARRHVELARLDVGEAQRAQALVIRSHKGRAAVEAYTRVLHLHGKGRGGGRGREELGGRLSGRLMRGSVAAQRCGPCWTAACAYGRLLPILCWWCVGVLVTGATVGCACCIPVGYEWEGLAAAGTRACSTHGGAHQCQRCPSPTLAFSLLRNLHGMRAWGAAHNVVRWEPLQHSNGPTVERAQAPPQPQHFCHPVWLPRCCSQGARDRLATRGCDSLPPHPAASQKSPVPPAPSPGVLQCVLDHQHLGVLERHAPPAQRPPPGKGAAGDNVALLLADEHALGVKQRAQRRRRLRANKQRYVLSAA